MSTDVQLIEVNPATPAPGRAPALDVIFIHGLGGHHVETWQPPSGDTWPQRVANAHPDVQVWSLAYPAKVGQLLSIGEMDQPGTRGLSVLATERMVTKKIGERRPCIFVCHSLGGLLAKRILLDAWAADPRNQRRFRHEGVKAVMFCGTPHRGSAIASVLKSMEWVKNTAPGIVMTYLGWDHARFAGLAARCLGRTSELIKELEQNNVDLQHLNEDFGRYYQDRAGSDFMVSVYAETKGMRVKGVPTAVVVPPESADPNLRTGAGIRLNVVAVPEKDHSELVKPASMSEWVVEGVDDLVGRILRDAPDGGEIRGAIEAGNSLATSGFSKNRRLDADSSDFNLVGRARHVVKNQIAKDFSQNEAQHEQGFIPLDRKTLKHQADHACKSLESANIYWTALQAADALLPYVGGENLNSPRKFIEYLHGLKPDQSPDVIAKVMGELRRTFTANRRNFSDVEAESAATSLVACFLYCACLMINPEGIGSAATVKLPSMGNSDAAGLMASLIALVMVGGRLDLQQGGRELPVGTGTYRLQKAGRNSEHDFERQLFTLIVKSPWTISAGLKTGPLSDDERAELLEELRDLRGDGIHTRVMCFIIDSEDHPGFDALGVARTIAVPVFHAHADIEATLFGIDGATLLTRLKHLWRDVSSHHRYDRVDETA